MKTRLSEHAEGLSCLAIIYNKKNMATNYNNRNLNLIPDLTFTFVENFILNPINHHPARNPSIKGLNTLVKATYKI